MGVNIKSSGDILNKVKKGLVNKLPIKAKNTVGDKLANKLFKKDFLNIMYIIVKIQI